MRAGAFAHNLELARRSAGGSRIWAVIKANAYGHGLLRAARAFAAALVDEGVERRQPVVGLVGVDVGELGGHPLGDDGWWFVSGSHGVLPFSLVVFTAILSPVRNAFYFAFHSGLIPVVPA